MPKTTQLSNANTNVLLQVDNVLLQVNNITFAYEQMPMHFDLTVNRGETLAILGASGSGKSTLLNLIAGFNQPLSGDIRFQQNSILTKTPAQRPITTLFQEHNLFNHLTVKQNIAIGLAPSMKLNAEQQTALETAAQQVEMTDLLHRLPADLSGGQRQRVGIARCLARKKPLLLLDEPFSSLDPALRQEMLRLIAKLNKEHGITVLMVTHNPHDALQIADNIAFIENGKIALHAPAAILADQDAPDMLKRYLGTLNK
ncbi:thiamine ABC transporter ATP-binding protein [Moritella sp.]|uniref:thiamine ABC transporter ATP-binding protein n=1 Tax=Moritella sp. TaxID=78556 RepID=UPI001DB3AE0F|nr:thiamine ABC transporter ATP-binding protein [Moritella sp.]MCJ8350104.1 thiamine ABC transporter ATP-binding protein [Moritella sp.]NQZ40954.1 thiamine ABC transporter ATP-binding protein [Moritella sp.]